MAKLLGGLGTSHVPSIGAALDKGLRNSSEWKPFFDGYIPGQDWVREHKPDIAVVIFNDHGNSFFLDKVPTFAVGCARGGDRERSRPSRERSSSPGTSSTSSWRAVSTL
jgi:protocatechuate 4,5-dioxygenase, beta chain